MDIIKRGRLGASDDATRRFLSIFDVGLPGEPRGRPRPRRHARGGGIVDGGDAAAVLDALDEIEAAGFDALPERGDVHVAVEEAVIERLGEAVGGTLHTARSRNDKGATYVRLALRGELLALVGAVLDLRATLLDRAGETADWLVAGYTHLQRAQPTTFGHHLAAHEAALGRDTERLIDAYGRVNRNPLGSCAMAGTGFDIDRERTTELLGFDRPMPNSMDGVAGWDFAVEAVSAAAATTNSLSRLCADLFVWSSREFGFAELDDRHAGSSSIMPQKKNPNTATAAELAAAVDAVRSG